MDIKIYYVYHSCFILEFESCYMMFDYYKHYSYKKEQDFDFDNLIQNIMESNKLFYIFVSHGHSDHFNKKIFDYNSSKVIYILSDDINPDKIKTKISDFSETSTNIKFISSEKSLDLGCVKIDTFSSTDLGLSFLIEIENKIIFYAGDLNWWAWSDDTEEEAKHMESLYKDIITKIKKSNKSIDIAFFPIDKRLEQNYDMGANYFIKQLEPKHFIPMHFGNEYESLKIFSNKYINIYSKINIVSIDNINSIVTV
jgi:L-ascorbate metabolism protein UlaG (beta-lactamase superfamily)